MCFQSLSLSFVLYSKNRYFLNFVSVECANHQWTVFTKAISFLLWCLHGKVQGRPSHVTHYALSCAFSVVSDAIGNCGNQKIAFAISITLCALQRTSSRVGSQPSRSQERRRQCRTEENHIVSTTVMDHTALPWRWTKLSSTDWWYSLHIFKLIIIHFD